uniref:Putative secreted protein n=1 Tax=Anopheles triannulatus TaxID=58253 RepID=A0A2M4B5K2_9DIPT
MRLFTHMPALSATMRCLPRVLSAVLPTARFRFQVTTPLTDAHRDTRNSSSHRRHQDIGRKPVNPPVGFLLVCSNESKVACLARMATAFRRACRCVCVALLRKSDADETRLLILSRMRRQQTE